ncbi:MAG: DNA mismatch repair protein MutS [Candidatus Rhabdochlamydia sp.]
MTTPMMLQWQACKAKAKGALLLFRLGDFYEAFEDDAKILAKELDLVLTQRQDIPMAGIPAHSVENYLDRLVSRGYRVAMAEQIEDPQAVKGLVKRDIVKVLTPGSVIQSSLLHEKTASYIAAISQVNCFIGIAFLDVTTGDFRVIELEDTNFLIDEITRLSPKEVLISEKAWKSLEKELSFLSLSNLQIKEEWAFDHRSSLERLMKQFEVHSLDGFGLKTMTASVNAAGALLSYVLDDLNLKLPHIKSIEPVHPGTFLWLDRTTQKHLELITPLYDKSTTLLSVLDETVTPMGGRLLKDWVLHPLVSSQDIYTRQEEIEKYVLNSSLRVSLRASLETIRDLERLSMRIESGYTSPRDLIALKLSLKALPQIEALLHTPLEDLSPVTHLIESALVDHPPLKLSDGDIFKPGFHPDLDQLRVLKTDSQAWLANYQTTLREQTGIKTLKVGYTQAFGYYIEVSRGQAEKMPLSFQRRQTLVNTERFISPELKDFEHAVYSAKDKMAFLENQLFTEIRVKVSSYAKSIRLVAKQIAHLDVILSLAHIAKERNYSRPLVDESSELMIIEGRHPVIEIALGKQTFIANDVNLSDQKEQLVVITGPNMAGKSTYIRQVALLTLMAQIGSFIPAKKAHIGVIDKLFTRIGASDDLSRGQSTFMVEMSETANILHNATSKSLVILDEIGRGTSTYDGIAIAWSIADYLLTTEGKKAKTLFATHYFELTELEKKIPGAVNYYVAVEESEKGIVFLHKILKGCGDKSYGIHVAKLAGLPYPVLKKAHEMLELLHQNHTAQGALSSKKSHPMKKGGQLALF